jgi:hypothetical protein
MKETHCPLCHSELEVRDVAPCEECGGFPEELEHFRQGKHTFTEYEVFPPLKVVLCNFCDVDFGSHDPTFFGLPARTRIGFEYMRPCRPVEVKALARDKFCPHCGLRLAFLRFVQRAREQHAR